MIETGYEKFRTCDLLHIVKTLIRRKYPQEDINLVALELAKRIWTPENKKSFDEIAQEYGYVKERENENVKYTNKFKNI